MKLKLLGQGSCWTDLEKVFLHLFQGLVTFCIKCKAPKERQKGLEKGHLRAKLLQVRKTAPDM